MCLEKSFCLFTKDALNFRQPKIYAAPHHTAVSRLLPLNRHTATRDTPFYHSAQLPLMLNGKTVRSNNALTRKVYVTLV